MTPRQLPWKWPLFGLLAVLLLAISLIPWLIGDTSRFGNRVAAELSTWTGGEVKFTGPVKVAFLPDVSVRGPIEVSDSRRLPTVQSFTVREAKVSLDLVQLLRGYITIDALRLLKPRILLNSTGPDAKLPPQLFAGLLGGAPLRVLHIRKGRIKLSHGSVREIFAHFDAKESGAISGLGSFNYNNATLRYSVETGALTSTDKTETLPIAITLSSKPLNAKLSGIVTVDGTLKLDGDMTAEIDDLRRFAVWSGVPLPEGQSLKAVSLAGGFQLGNGSLSFDDGTFTLDGNKAVGLLAVTPEGRRPRIEGTLAFDKLTLDPFITSGRQSSSSLPVSQTSPFDGALLNHIDVDLRISAAEMTAGAVKFGHGAFTITAKDGSVSGEIGELELCGGAADGRFGAELAPASKQVKLAADLNDLALPSCLQAFGLDIPLAGIADMKLDLASEGNSYAELIKNLAGTAQAKVNAGTVPIDLARLMTSTPPLDASGWDDDAPTSFDQLSADCRIDAGDLWCQSLKIATPGGTFLSSGGIDLPKGTIDWTLSVPAQPGVAEATAVAGPTASIRGPLAQPVIRRTERSTIGESNPSTPVKSTNTPN